MHILFLCSYRQGQRLAGSDKTSFQYRPGPLGQVLPF